MRRHFAGFLPLLALLALGGAARADEFSQIENSPHTYWVPPAATAHYAPGPYYYGAYYGGPPGYYYGPPPPPPPPPAPVVIIPRLFFGFHFR